MTKERHGEDGRSRSSHVPGFYLDENILTDDQETNSCATWEERGGWLKGQACLRVLETIKAGRGGLAGAMVGISTGREEMPSAVLSAGCARTLIHSEQCTIQDPAGSQSLHMDQDPCLCVSWEIRSAASRGAGRSPLPFFPYSGTG